MQNNYNGNVPNYSPFHSNTAVPFYAPSPDPFRQIPVRVPSHVQSSTGSQSVQGIAIGFGRPEAQSRSQDNPLAKVNFGTGQRVNSATRPEIYNTFNNQPIYNSIYHSQANSLQLNESSVIGNDQVPLRHPFSVRQVEESKLMTQGQIQSYDSLGVSNTNPI